MKNGKKLPVGRLVITFGILFLAIVFGSVVDFVTDYLWFKELGFVSVFFKQLITEVKIFVPAFVGITLITFIYLKILKKAYFKDKGDVAQNKKQNKVVDRVGLVASILNGLLLGFMLASNLWFEILQVINNTTFNLKDPLFDKDISFYIFKLDFINKLNGIIFFGIFIMAVITVLYYVLLAGIKAKDMGLEDIDDDGQRVFDNMDEARSGNGREDKFVKGGRLFFSNVIEKISAPLVFLGVLFFLNIGLSNWLKQYTLLFDKSTGVVTGAGYTNVNVDLWVYKILMVLAVLSALLLIIGSITKKYRLMVLMPLVMFGVGIVGSLASVGVENWIVSPNPINKESKYLEDSIKYTRLAYNLQDVEIKPFEANNKITKKDIENNMETISNIRINDYVPAQKFYNQTQSIRTYYTFKDVDVDRYFINGDYTQTFLAAREIDESRISDEWLSRHLKYTHGYGISLSRVDQVTKSGQPDMLISGIPPKSKVNGIQIERPEIYFGEISKNYILTNTGEKEFDYPNGDANEYTIYKGKAGIKLTPLNRLLFAIKEKSLKLLISTNINSDSKIILNRNIEQRVKKIMPKLIYDKDPYIVTADGKLYWMLDAYTASANFPYSEPIAEVKAGYNYLRNSVKVVVDAYNGDTFFYLVDDKDPIATTYKKIYPELFKDFDKMPDSLKSHIRYPKMLFGIQADIYRRYHMSDVGDFYIDEDRWDIAKEIYGTKEHMIEPNYYIMKLPGEKKAEFVNTIPYNPKNRKNLIGLLVARNDGDNYGKIQLYKLPKDKNIYGPMQIEAQIDQNTEISKEFSLWNSSGSTYSRGNLFIIPIEKSLLYVEPVYLEATNSSIPEVKRVIVAYGDRIAYKKTLAEALDYLFGSKLSNENKTEKPDGKNVEKEPNTNDNNANVEENSNETMSMEDLVSKASENLKLAEEAQRNGDWASYGKYMDEVERYLNLYMEQVGK